MRLAESRYFKVLRSTGTVNNHPLFDVSAESISDGRLSADVQGRCPLSSQTIEFVNVQDTDSRLQIQRHSMQQYARQKRLRQIEKLRDGSGSRSPQWQQKQVSIKSDQDEEDPRARKRKRGSQARRTDSLSPLNSTSTSTSGSASACSASPCPVRTLESEPSLLTPIKTGDRGSFIFVSAPPVSPIEVAPPYRSQYARTQKTHSRKILDLEDTRQSVRSRFLAQEDGTHLTLWHSPAANLSIKC